MHPFKPTPHVDRQFLASREAISRPVTPASGMTLSRRMHHDGPPPKDVGRMHTALLVGNVRPGTGSTGSRSRAATPVGGVKPRESVHRCCTPVVDPNENKRRVTRLEAMMAAGDYEADFDADRRNAEHQAALRAARGDVRSLTAFDQATRQRERAASAASVLQRTSSRSGVSTGPASRGSTLPSSSGVNAPRIILSMFRFRNVRNLPAVRELRKVGYPELHEQFSVAANSVGVLLKHDFLGVVEKYLSVHEHADALRILECFDGNGHGDVELQTFLVGLQILLGCASPADTLRYCFQLLGASSKTPCYMTRYEAQTLITYADEAALAEIARGGHDLAQHETPEERIEAHGDRDYKAMRGVISALVDDSSRYDYSGRMPLNDFLAELESRLDAITAGRQTKKQRRVQQQQQNGSAAATPAKRSGASPTAAGRRVSVASPAPAEDRAGVTRRSFMLTGGGNDTQSPPGSPVAAKAKSDFVFGRAWQGAGGLVHRMSSRKMIIAALQKGDAGAASPAMGRSVIA